MRTQNITHLVLAYSLAASAVAQPTPSSVTGLIAPIPIQISLPVGQPFFQDQPLGVGVPFGRGKLLHVEDLRVVNSLGQAVPSQISVRTRWPGTDSVRWAWVDFHGDPHEAYRVINAPSQPPPTPPTPTSVRETDDAIVVDTGVATFHFDKDSGTPTAVEVGSQTIVGDGHGVYAVDGQAVTAVLRANRRFELTWSIEDAGPLRTVLRVEGTLLTPNSLPRARAILHYHFDAGSSAFRLDHTFVLSEETAPSEPVPLPPVRFSEVGVRMPWAPLSGSPAYGVFGGANGSNHTIPITAGPGWVAQDSVPHFAESGSAHRVSISGDAPQQGELPGWAIATSSSAAIQVGLGVQVRDFGPQFPKGLQVDGHHVTAQLWVEHQNFLLDLDPDNLVPNYFGNSWIDAAKQAEMVKVAHAYSGVGASKTHELRFEYITADSTSSIAPPFADRSAAFDEPIYVTCDPEHVASTLVVGPLLPKGTAFPEVEHLIESFFSLWQKRLDVFPMTGWFSRGVGPELYYVKKNGQVQAAVGEFLKNGDPATARLHQGAPYNAPRSVWTAYLRSGDRRYVEFAERNAKFISDFKFIHWDGAKRRRGLLAVRSNPYPVYWQGEGLPCTGGQTTDHVAPLAFAYLVRDRRWALDTIRDYSDWMTAQPWAAGAVTDWIARGNYKPVDLFAMMLQMISACEALGDPDLEQALRNFTTRALDLSKPMAVSTDLWTSAIYSNFTQPGWAVYKWDHKVLAMMDYLDYFGEVDVNATLVRGAVERAADHLFAFACTKAGLAYQNFSPAYLARAYQITGKEDYRRAVAAQIVAAIDQLAELEAKGYTDGELALAGTYTNPEGLYVTTEKIGMPLLAVPQALGLGLFVDESELRSIGAGFPYAGDRGQTPSTPSDTYSYAKTKLQTEKLAGVPLDLDLALIGSAKLLENPADPVVRFFDSSTSSWIVAPGAVITGMAADPMYFYVHGNEGSTDGTPHQNKRVFRAKVHLPASAPAGCYEIDTLGNRYLVIGSDLDRIQMTPPEAGYFGCTYQESWGFGLIRGKPFFFDLAGSASQPVIKIKVAQEAVTLVDPKGGTYLLDPEPNGALKEHTIVVPTTMPIEGWSLLPASRSNVVLLSAAKSPLALGKEDRLLDK